MPSPPGRPLRPRRSAWLTLTHFSFRLSRTWPLWAPGHSPVRARWESAQERVWATVRGGLRLGRTASALRTAGRLLAGGGRGLLVGPQPAQQVGDLGPELRPLGPLLGGQFGQFL